MNNLCSWNTFLGYLLTLVPCSSTLVPCEYLATAVASNHIPR